MYRKLSKFDVYGRERIWEVNVEDCKLCIKSYFKKSKKKRTFIKLMATEKKCIQEAISKTSRKLKMGYKDSIKCMELLPMTYEEKWIKLGCFQQPKLSGLRCIAYYDESWKLTNEKKERMNFFNNVKNDLDRFFDKSLIYDGVLTEDGMYNIFDIISDDIQCYRLEKLFTFIDKPFSNIKIVETVQTSSIHDIKELHKRFLEQGYRASVIRSRHALYEDNPSRYCLKIVT